MTDTTGWTPEEADTILPDEDEGAASSQAYDNLSIIELLSLLIVEGRDYARTEAERQKLRARIFGRALRDAVIAGAIALFLLMGTMVALLVGLIWAVSEWTGNALSATAIVTGGALIAVIALLLFAKGRIQSALRHIVGKKDQA